MDASEMEELMEVLGRLQREPPSAEAAGELLERARSQELRDADWEDEALVLGLQRALGFALARGEPEDDAFVAVMLEAATRLLEFPELDDQVTAQLLGAGLAQDCLRRLESAALDTEAEPLAGLLHRAYVSGDEKARGAMRVSIGGFLARAQKSHAFQGLRAVLRLVAAIVSGFGQPLSKANKQLLTDILLPLHATQGKISPTEPALGVFHEELVLCVLAFLRADPGLTRSTIQSLVGLWPATYEGNTRKEVLMLHEFEMVLDLEVAAVQAGAPPQLDYRTVSVIVGKLGTSIASDFSMLSEKALVFWKNKPVVDYLFGFDQVPERPLLQTVLRPLLAHAISHWNKTVTVMAGTVLRTLADEHPDQVLENVRALWPEQKDAEDFLTKLLGALRAEEGEANDGDDTHASAAGQATGGSGRTAASGRASVATVPAKQDVGFMNMIIAEELGNGSFSQVFRALRVVQGKPRSQWGEYALKRMDARHRSVALREIRAMERVKHPNCTQLIGWYESAGSINLVVEFAGIGDLHSAISAKGTFDLKTTLFVAAEVGAGLGAVHAEGLLFGDVKPENVLVHANGHVKLGDFGAARELDAVASGEAPLEGTLSYLAPELFARRDAQALVRAGGAARPAVEVPEAVDWWAFGCLVYQMLTGRPPLWVESDRDVHQSLVKFQMDRFPEGFPGVARSLVDALLSRDVSTRLGSRGGSAEVERHAAFAEELGLAFDEAHLSEAPAFTKGEIKPTKGPWNQRAFSIMMSALPQAYSASDSQAAALEAVEERQAERAAPWKGGREQSFGIRAATRRDPAAYAGGASASMPAPAARPAARGRGGARPPVSQFMTVLNPQSTGLGRPRGAGASRGGRRPRGGNAPSPYAVHGLDLKDG